MNKKNKEEKDELQIIKNLLIKQQKMNWEDEEPVEYVSLLVLQYFPTKLLEFSWKYFFWKVQLNFFPLFNTFFNSWKYGAHFLIFYVTCSSETSRKICTKEDEGALIKRKNKELN